MRDGGSARAGERHDERGGGRGSSKEKAKAAHDGRMRARPTDLLLEVLDVDILWPPRVPGFRLLPG